MHLIAKLLIGMGVGLALGFLGWEVPIQIMVTFKMLFGQFISFIIPLIVLFYLLHGIGSLQRQSGKLLASTIIIAYVSTICAGTLAYFASREILPLILTTTQNAQADANVVTPLFEFRIPPPINVITALVLAFCFGIAMSITQAKAFKTLAHEGQEILSLILAKIIVPLLPIYIASIFCELTFNGTVFTILHGFGIVLVLAITLHIIWLLLFYRFATWFSRQPFFSSLKNMFPAYLTALGCMSSAATLPVTLNCCKKLNINSSISDFTIPLCATIHLCGSTITILCCAMAVSAMDHSGQIPSLSTAIPFILMLGITMIAAPGAPGGAVMSALGLLSSILGFSDANLALMIALYIAQDGFGTACNVTGDGAIALVVDQMENQFNAKNLTKN